MDDPIVDDVPFLAPWQKVGLWLLMAVVFAGILILFAGRTIVFHRQQAKASTPPQVQMDNHIAPLNRPTVLAEDTRPGYTPPPRGQKGGKQQPDEERIKALNSDIGAYYARTQGASGAAASATEKPLPGTPDALEASLLPTPMDGTKVSELPNPRWLIEQGRILPCTQQTKINSTLPGGVSAIVPEEIRGETGDVVLFDKGAKVFGTVQHALMNGSSRLAVLWQNITTPVLYDASGMPHQFRIAVNSPASSELGETGLDGDVNRHLGLKIGGIIGFSLVQGAIQAGIQEASSKQRGTQINLNQIQQGGNSATETLLNAWVNIPDVMTRDQGLACSIQLVRDLDMRAAYKLRMQYRGNR